MVKECSKLIIMVAGFPGTGKSTIAAVLRKRLHAVVLNKDVIREQLFAEKHIDYTREQDDFCMEVVFLITEYIFRAKPEQAVIIDGRTFSKAYQVEKVLSRARLWNARPLFIECVCSDSVVKQRLEYDQNAGTHPARNRNYALYLTIKEKADPLTVDRLVIDTGSESPAASVERCMMYLENNRFNRKKRNRP